MSSPASDWCQRWNTGQHSWRHRSEGGFDASRYDAAAIDENMAKGFVVGHHYSGTYPAASQRYGLFEGDELVGVTVLSVPVQAKVLTSAFETLVPYEESLEIGRLVMLDRVPGNGESFFLGRVFRLAAAEGIRGLLSMSDPMPRRNAAGELIKPGHVGVIYKASNATYLGRATPRSLVVLPDGAILNARSMQKVRAQSRGHGHVERLLIAHGARPMRSGDKPAVWLAEALDEVRARRVRHKGNHRYAFAIGPTRRTVAIGGPALPYPKQPDKEAA